MTKAAKRPQLITRGFERYRIANNDDALFINTANGAVRFAYDND